MPFADADGYRLYYEVHGSGDPVICPGGWGILTGSGHGRLPQSLRDRYTTIVFDHRGLGQSSDNGQPISTVDLGDDAALVARAAGFEQVHVYGHGGLGACLSQHMAARHPNLVRSLVLVSGWAGPDRYKQAQHAMGQFVFEAGGFAAYRRFGALSIHTPEFYNANEALILSDEGAWAEFLGTDLDALRKIQHATADHDARQVLGSIEIPTLVIHGELDLVDPPRLGRELVALIPNSRLEVIPATPHSMRSYPEGFALLGRLVDAFLARHSVLIPQAAR